RHRGEDDYAIGRPPPFRGETRGRRLVRENAPSAWAALAGRGRQRPRRNPPKASRRPLRRRLRESDLRPTRRWRVGHARPPGFACETRRSLGTRSEERRVGKECRVGWWAVN